jgi:hypothetical protein
MKSLYAVGKEEIRDLLGKGWLTHDGMWFYRLRGVRQFTGVFPAGYEFPIVADAGQCGDIDRFLLVADVVDTCLKLFNSGKFEFKSV